LPVRAIHRTVVVGEACPLGVDGAKQSLVLSDPLLRSFLKPRANLHPEAAQVVEGFGLHGGCRNGHGVAGPACLANGSAEVLPPAGEAAHVQGLAAPPASRDPPEHPLVRWPAAAFPTLDHS